MEETGEDGGKKEEGEEEENGGDDGAVGEREVESGRRTMLRLDRRRRSREQVKNRRGRKLKWSKKGLGGGGGCLEPG